MRILHAPNNIANQAWASAQGLRALGHEVDVWQFGTDPYAAAADRVFDIAGDPRRAFDAFHGAIDRNYDVYHFHSALSLVPPVGGLPWFWDLPLLRALGKRIVFTLHGSDEERIQGSLAVVRTYAQMLIVASPLDRSFVPEAEYVPKAIDLPGFPFAGPRRHRRPLVVHVPSKRAPEGTDAVVRGLQELERLGIEFDFRLVTDVSHADVRRIYADADVVVDDVVLGDVGLSSIEAMALGKPVVTRVRDEVRIAHPDLPAVNADPATFVDAITPVLADGDRRRRLGEHGRAYVERTHAAEVVAATLAPFYATIARPVWRVFPEWTGLSSDRKFSDHERRVRELEGRIADLARRLAGHGTVQDLRALYGDTRPVRIFRNMLRARRR